LPGPRAKAESLGSNSFDYGYTATFSGLDRRAGEGPAGYGTAEESGFGVNTVSASQALYRKGLNCGACFRVQCHGSQLCLPRPTPVLTVTNVCPPNGPGGWCNGVKKSYTLAPAIWNHIATNPNLAVSGAPRPRRLPCSCDTAKGGMQQAWRDWSPDPLQPLLGAPTQPFLT